MSFVSLENRMDSFHVLQVRLNVVTVKKSAALPRHCRRCPTTCCQYAKFRARLLEKRQRRHRDPPGS